MEAVWIITYFFDHFLLRSTFIEYRKFTGIGFKGEKIIEYKGQFFKTIEEIDKMKLYYRNVMYFFLLKYNGGFIDSTQCGNAGR